MHDSVKVWSHGLPSVVVVTKPFRVLAQLQARSLGLPDLPMIVLPDSFADLKAEAVEAEVERAANQAVAEILALRGHVGATTGAS